MNWLRLIFENARKWWLVSPSTPSLRASGWILAAISIALPILLSASAWRTYTSLLNQREVYLRGRVASIAARLENIPRTAKPEDWADQLTGEDDGALIGLTVFDRPSPDLAALWEGRELFRETWLSATSASHGSPVFRVHMPFHHNGKLHLARIDLDTRSADFLVTPALHHLWLVGICSLLIVILVVVSARHSRIAARATQRQLELEHLAHIGEMSAVLAHEIRNPLGTIKGYAQLLAERSSGPEDSNSPLVAPILQQTARLENLVKDLLLYGKPASPTFESVNSPAIASFLQQHAARFTGRMDFRVAVSPFVLETDPALLEQILLNLFRNAVEAVQSTPMTGVSPLVTFEASAIGLEAVMRVTDNGPGFSPEALRRLREPFYTSKATGTGLGLCISHKLALTLGGSLAVGNNSSGAAAVLRLPLKADR